MELDRTTIKSLSSETRIDILKSLARRRKMPTELAKEFGMAASTISEHLKNLEDSRLIQRKETGHKWIYYELTEKGNTLVKPQYTPQFVVILVLGGLIFLGAFATFFQPYSSQFSSQYEINSLADAALTSPSVISQEKVTGALKAASSFNETENKEREDTSIIQTVETEQEPEFSLYTIVFLVIGAVMMVASFGLPKKYRMEIN